MFILWGSRRLHGRRGLKYHSSRFVASALRRRLHGRRGLKSLAWGDGKPETVSPPSRAAWIEIYLTGWETMRTASPPSRAAWIEIVNPQKRRIHSGSPPSRAAWIEIEPGTFSGKSDRVAAFTGGVD